jgi:hypothetical protein
MIFSMIFDKVQAQFGIWNRIRIYNLKLRIRILQKVSDPYGIGSGSTTLIQRHWLHRGGLTNITIRCRLESFMDTCLWRKL